jgi:spermidine synthase
LKLGSIPSVAAALLAFGAAWSARAAEPEGVTTAVNGRLWVATEEGQLRLYAESATMRVMQSAMDLAHPTRLVEPYTQIMSLVTALHPAPETAFNLGLGGGVLPRFHLSRYPHSVVVSAEIDPEVLKIARRDFKVEAPRHIIVEGDGVAVLAKEARRFDVIWIDAFDLVEGVPRTLVGEAFLDQAKAKLASGGILMINLWLPDRAAVDAAVKRYRSRFRHGLAVQIPRAPNQILAVSDSDRLRCDRLMERLAEWRNAGRVTLELDRPCREVPR